MMRVRKEGFIKLDSEFLEKRWRRRRVCACFCIGSLLPRWIREEGKKKLCGMIIFMEAKEFVHQKLV